MDYAIDTVFGKLICRTDADGIALQIGRRRHAARWVEVTAAALVVFPNSSEDSAVPSDVWGKLGEGLPGLGRLMDINTFMAENYRQVILARGPLARRAIRAPLPMDDPAAQALVAEIQQRLGDRWQQEVAIADHYQALGIKRQWWAIPASILFLIALGYTVAFACAGFTTLAEGDFNLPLPAWIGMGVWLALIGAILFVYRRMK
jgi:hypothetical protein